MENQLVLSAFRLLRHSIQMDLSLPRPALQALTRRRGPQLKRCVPFVPPASIFSVRKAHVRSKIQKLI